MDEGLPPRGGDESRFRALADGLPVPVWWCGPDKGLEYANEAWLAFTGRRLEEQRGLGWLEAVHPDDRERCLATLEGALARGAPFALELRLRRHDGAWRWVEDRGTPVGGEGGALAGFACCAVEVHRQRRLRRALARALRAAQGREMLLVELHHRVKNTLQMIGSLLAILARRVPDGSRALVREMARRVRAFGLAHEALAPGARGGGAVELGRFLVEVTEGLRDLAQGREVRVDVRVEPGLALPVGRAAPLGLAVNELVTNALKYGFPDGRAGTVAVEARRRPDGGVEVTVADDGAGLPEGAWPPKGASSLGLPLVAGLARQVGASVAVAREAGTRFVLVVPPAEPPGGDAAGPGAGGPDPLPVSPPGVLA
jgi:two-component system, sensor histidine kinase PdtaS